jgi:outer membrane protein assembly factor BamE (lipoprotein component of BamABCDE complex)
MLLAAAACSPIADTRGHMVDTVRLEQLTPGVSTAQDVVAVLGTPTTVGTFDDRNWYYIGQRIERLAFFEPEVTDRRVVAVRFSDDGTLQEIRQLGLEEGQDIEMVGRQTPTLGREMGFMEQMFGNIGRFTGDDGQ